MLLHSFSAKYGVPLGNCRSLNRFAADLLIPEVLFFFPHTFYPWLWKWNANIIRQSQNFQETFGMQSISADIHSCIRKAIISLLLMFIILFMLHKIWYLEELFLKLCACVSISNLNSCCILCFMWWRYHGERTRSSQRVKFNRTSVRKK